MATLESDHAGKNAGVGEVLTGCTYRLEGAILPSPRAGVAQRLERRPVTPEVAGSNPVVRASTFRPATVAQLVEHSTENARVPGSNPGCGTFKNSGLGSTISDLLSELFCKYLRESEPNLRKTRAQRPIKVVSWGSAVRFADSAGRGDFLNV